MASDTTQPVGVEDVAGVRSRISWGAILGGSVLAVAVYLVLTFFFAALGVSLSSANIGTDTGMGLAAAAALVTIFTSLFIGGWVTAQLTAGETQREAMLYGVLTWAVVTGVALAAVGMGVRAGYFAAVSGTLIAQNSPGVQQQSLEDALRPFGVSPEAVERLKADAKARAEQAKATAEDPEAQRKAEKTAIAVAWIAFAGTLLSIAAGVAGAVVGSGPEFRLFPVVAGRRSDILLAR